MVRPIRLMGFVPALLIAGCSGGSGTPTSSPIATIPAPAPTPAPSPTPTPTPTPAPSPASVEREIAPDLTNPAISTALSPHVVINPSPAVAARGRLFVMLPGTGAVARTYRLILRTGAPRGYHVVGLTYPNDDAVEGLCGASADPNCAGDLRREIITGADTSPLAAVNRANSIIGRLESLLGYLSTTFPSEGWGQYLVNGRVNWALVTVAGHSQGGGHAAFLAKLESLDRTVMFSAPGDTGVAANTSAAWLSMPNVTPVARQYGFTHVNDTLIALSTVTRNWSTIGINSLGPVTSVDGASSPFGNSRQLTTAAAPNPNPTGISASPTHGAPVVDAVTPLTPQNTPLYAPVWIYLAFP